MHTSTDQTTPTSHPLIQHNVPLHDKNWFGTGGAAAHYAQPTSSAQFAQAIEYAKTHNLPICLLGEGANVLISDAGFAGLIIHPRIMNMEIVEQHPDYALIRVGAGVAMRDLITWCFSQNLIGLEEFSGIPGTIGGSVFINLHYFEFLLEQFLISGEIIDAQTGEISHVDNDWFNFGYDHSTLHDRHHYLVSALFKVKTASDSMVAYARGRHDEMIRHRNRRYPIKGTCGSFFRNFHPQEVHLSINNNKMIYVAYYLDKIGVKGSLRVGNAIVSHQHANMLVNTGGATSAEIIALATQMQKMVFDSFGVIPQPECVLIGFDKSPFLI